MRNKRYNNSDRIIYHVLVCIILFACLVVTYEIANIYIDRTTDESADTDIRSVLMTQAYIVEDRIDDLFVSLEETAAWPGIGEDISSGEHHEYYKNMVVNRGYSDLIYVDSECNAVNFEGKYIENHLNNEDLTSILSGETDRVICESDADGDSVVDDFCLCVPITDKGNTIGIIAAPICGESLTDVMIADNVFSGSAEMYILDDDGDVVAQSNSVNNDSENTDVVSDTMPIGYGNWVLKCVIPDKNLVDKYQDTSSMIHRLLLVILGIFMVVMIFICISNIIIEKRIRTSHMWMKEQYENCLKVFEGMECAIVDYNVQEHTLQSNPLFDKMFHCELLHGDESVADMVKKQHPEVDFSLIEKGIHIAIERHATSSVDSFMVVDNEIIWAHVVLIPFMNENNEVQHVVLAVQNVTEQHNKFDDARSTLEHIPGGIHKCYLSEPIHLEYANDGLIEFLGYSREEFEDILGPERDYCHFILEEDQETFEEFVLELSKEEKTDNCTYHLKKKDGSLALVSEIMESKLDENGIMYGYSLLSDITEFIDEANILKEELEDTREQLNQARIKISTSQMQPHFLYNALSSIRELILDEPEYASDLVYDFTVHLRACIKSMTSDELIPIYKEVENIRAYTEIERMRLGDRLKIEMIIEDEDFQVIPLGVQPIVENSIRHGVYPKGREGGTVTIHTYRDGNAHVIDVKDDGIGFNVDEMIEAVESGERDSTGIFNIIYRFKSVMNAEVKLMSNIGVGTTVRIIIPESK